MATIIEDLTIDVSKIQSFRLIKAKQYDNNSRKRRLIITDSNIPITYSDDRHEYIVLTLYSNGIDYSNTRCQFGSDGYPYITFTDHMLSVAGEIKCEIRIWDRKGGAVLSTFSFGMEVHESLLNYDRIVNSSEYNFLNDLIEQAIEIPYLIKEFNLSQTQIENLIKNINDDISSYSSTFSALSSEAQALISDIQSFLTTSQLSETTRVNAERGRVEAEKNRQNDTANSIVDAQNATLEASRAATEAIEAAGATNDAIKEAEKQASIAHLSAERCDDAILNIQFTVVDMNGGDALTNVDEYNDIYDGGGA